MIIRREALNAALAATTADDTRYFLHAVCLEPDGRVVATNGHVLLIATDKTPIADGEFPIVPGAEFHGTPTARTLLPAETAKGLLSAMPKKSSIPVLSCIQVSMNGSPTTATVAATDLNMPRVATVDSAAHPTFPAYERVMPDPSKAAVRVTLAIDVLETLIKAAKAVNPGRPIGTSITFAIPKNAKNDPAGATVLSAVHVTINGADVDVTGCAMPMRK